MFINQRAKKANVDSLSELAISVVEKAEKAAE